MGQAGGNALAFGSKARHYLAIKRIWLRANGFKSIYLFLHAPTARGHTMPLSGRSDLVLKDKAEDGVFRVINLAHCIITLPS